MILVTGATGFIGRAIVGRLLAAGRAVVVLARSRDGVEARARVAEVFGQTPGHDGLQVVEGDLTAIEQTLGSADRRRLRSSRWAICRRSSAGWRRCRSRTAPISPRPCGSTTPGRRRCRAGAA